MEPFNDTHTHTVFFLSTHIVFFLSTHTVFFLSLLTPPVEQKQILIVVVIYINMVCLLQTTRSCQLHNNSLKLQNQMQHEKSLYTAHCKIKLIFLCTMNSYSKSRLIAKLRFILFEKLLTNYMNQWLMNQYYLLLKRRVNNNIIRSYYVDKCDIKTLYNVVLEKKKS